MELSERIANLRESKGIKQYEVANALGVEPPNYSRLEKRGDKLSIEQLKAIAGALGVSLIELLGFDEPVENNTKIEELEKRVVELESRIIDKDSRIETFEVSLIMIYQTIAAELIGSLTDTIETNGGINILYKYKASSLPYELMGPRHCEFDDSARNRALVSTWVNEVAKENWFFREFVASDLYSLDIFIKHLNDYSIITYNRNNISEVVANKIKQESDLFISMMKLKKRSDG